MGTVMVMAMATRKGIRGKNKIICLFDNRSNSLLRLYARESGVSDGQEPTLYLRSFLCL